jgi:gentisate 1,2-dioxygenase
MSVTPAQFDAAGNMQELYDLLTSCGIENGWNKPEPSLWPLPRKDFLPAHWSYAIGKSALNAAGRFVNTELAERRNLILANPVAGNKYPTVKTLVAAYQMVKAGERARSHRHTANALRLVLDTAENAFTIVGGKKIPMLPGDVLLTPNWSWHGHSNESAENAYWMDFLDVPMVHMLGPMFFEHHPDAHEAASEIVVESPFRFPFTQSVERLDAAPEISSGVRRIQLGAPALDTIALHVTRIEAGATYVVEPSTVSTIWAGMKGAGSALIDGETFAFARGDALAGPRGATQMWSAHETVYLLSVSDEPVLKALSWLRPIKPA